MTRFEMTRTIDAHYYIVDGGMGNAHVVGRREWLRTAKNDMQRKGETYGMAAYMFYVGDSFVPLTIAVLSWSESDAYSAVEDWARQANRMEELEDEDGNPTYIRTDYISDNDVINVLRQRYGH